MRAPKKIAIATAIAGGLMCVAAPAALAASGSVSNGYGYTSFNDDGDSYTVCDTAADGMSAVGRISVRQADGSWNNFDWRYDSNGADNSCAGNNVDIIREASDVKLTICRQDLSAGGPIRDCAYRIISG